VKGALTRSLSRLGLPYVDIYYCHRIPSLEKAIEFAHACKRCMEEGLCKAIGLSEISAAWLRKVHEQVPIYCVQQEWSLATRGLEEEIVPVCAELVCCCFFMHVPYVF
jgi:aryl-alcohol dehydrogenase-like predicted oxidoreductase